MSILQTVIKTTTTRKKRLGQGYGSGKGGHTVGRGQKGQKSRKGKSIPLWFEGGQLPGVKKFPMIRGKSRFSTLVPTAEITLTDLQKLPTAIVTLETLKLHKIIDPRFKKAKIIMSGTLTHKRQIKGIPTTARARQAIEK